MQVPLYLFTTIFLLFVSSCTADKGHGDKLQHYLGLIVKAHNMLGSSLNDVEEFLSTHDKYKLALGTLLGDMRDLKDHIQSVGNAEEDARDLSREKWQNMTRELGFEPREPKAIVFQEPVDQFTDIQRLIRHYITGVDEDGDEWIEAAALSVMFFQHVQALTTEATKEVTSDDIITRLTIDAKLLHQCFARLFRREGDRGKARALPLKVLDQFALEVRADILSGRRKENKVTNKIFKTIERLRKDLEVEERRKQQKQIETKEDL